MKDSYLSRLYVHRQIFAYDKIADGFNVDSLLSFGNFYFKAAAIKPQTLLPPQPAFEKGWREITYTVIAAAGAGMI